MPDVGGEIEIEFERDWKEVKLAMQLMSESIASGRLRWARFEAASDKDQKVSDLVAGWRAAHP